MRLAGHLLLFLIAWIAAIEVITFIWVSLPDPRRNGLEALGLVIQPIASILPALLTGAVSHRLGPRSAARYVGTTALTGTVVSLILALAYYGCLALSSGSTFASIEVVRSTGFGLLCSGFSALVTFGTRRRAGAPSP